MIYKEFELPDTHPAFGNLNRMLEWVRSSDVPNQISGQLTGDGDLSEEFLNKVIAKEALHNCRMSRFDHKYDFSDIQKDAEDIYQEQTGITDYLLVSVAKTWYPANGGHIGWHIDNEGGRLYASWSDGESFFRYRDPVTKEIITSYDKPNQWTFRIFTFDPENPLWHCVYAKDVRVSVGYRFVAKS
jgi:hypothetical protein